MSELNKCFIGEERSFLNELYYQNTFNEEKFNNIIYEIISRIEKNEIDNDNKFLIELFFLFSKLNQALISHFDGEDLYDIMNYSESLRTHVERLNFLMERYLDKDFNKIIDYEDILGKLGR